MNCQVTPFRNKISLHDSTVSLNDDSLTLSRRTPLSYRNESIDLQSKSMDWFLYDNGVRLERVKYHYLSFHILSYMVIC